MNSEPSSILIQRWAAVVLCVMVQITRITAQNLLISGYCRKLIYVLMLSPICEQHLVNKLQPNLQNTAQNVLKVHLSNNPRRLFIVHCSLLLLMFIWHLKGWLKVITLTKVQTQGITMATGKRADPKSACPWSERSEMPLVDFFYTLSTSPPHSTKPKIYLQHMKSLIFAL